MSYNSYFDSKTLKSAHFKLNDAIENKKSNAVYSAVVADTNVAVTDKAADGKTIIKAVAAGVTNVTVYEKIGSAAKRKLGTITLEITEDNLAEIVDISCLDDSVTGIDQIWLKIDFNKKTYDLKSAFVTNLLSNEATGVVIAPEDYSFKSIETNDAKVATVNEDGVVSAVSSGETEIVTTFKFVDNSETEFYSSIRVSGDAIKTVEGYTIDNIRDYIVGIDTPIELANGKTQPLINFDNAATTPAFKAVQDAINEELEMYGSIGRGYSQKSNHSTDVYNSVRDKVIQFLGADPETYTCFYTNSTTDGLNKLASALVENKNDIVLTTRIEHHANDLSWRERCKVIYAEVDDQGRVIYDDIERLLKKNKVKIVSISAASNVTGYVNDVHRVAKMAHKYGAKLVVDGAQIVAHRKVEMLGDINDPDDDIDFIAFSAHKMYSPYGGGAVVGLTSELNEHMPTFYGGGTIMVVGDDWQVYKQAPAVYEAGSPNYPGVVGLGKAIDVLSTIGMDKIQAHEKVLNRKVIDGLKTLPNVIIYGDSEYIDDRVGVISFNFHDINTMFLAEQLSQLGGVATRRGAFCAHPYVWRLMGIDDETARGFANCSDANTAGMVRLSFGIYNNEDEVDQFFSILPDAMQKAKELNPHEEANPEY